MVDELDQIGLFDERTDRQGLGGQPKRLLELRKGRFFAAGLTFSRYSFEIAVLDLAGQIVDRRSVRPGDRSVLAIAKAASDTLDSIVMDRNLDRSTVVGIGCAMPGNFGDGGQSLLAHGVFAYFDSPSVLEAFKAAFELPVWLENDGSSAAIGEHVYGRQPNDGASLFFLHLGHGLGGGAVVNGAPFRGVNGNACLPGFLFPYGQPRPSGLDLLETLDRAGHRLDDFGDLEPALELYPEIDQWIDRAGEQLSVAVLAASAFLDPSIIVVGGRLPRSINQRLVERIHGTSERGPSRGLSVAPTRAAELCLNLGDADNQAARFSASSVTSTPSGNLVPSMSFGN